MNVLLNDALAWSAELGLPLTRTEALALAVLALAVALVMVRLLFKLRWRRRRRVSLPLARVVRGPKLMGYGAILLFFGGFGAWAMIATLASAAIAPGVVSPDGSRKTIEHLEGGIVREIYVGEGDQVQAGQVLVSLEDVKARAEFEELRERFVHLVTTRSAAARGAGGRRLDCVSARAGGLRSGDRRTGADRPASAVCEPARDARGARADPGPAHSADRV